MDNHPNPEPPEPPEPLERRPEARAFKVEDLMAELRLGRVRIPSFQRGIRWMREVLARHMKRIPLLGSWQAHP